MQKWPALQLRAKPAIRTKEILLTLSFLYLLDHDRNSIKQVTNYSIICDVKNRGFRVLVDCDDGAGVLHADYVLNGTRNAEGNIQLRCNGLAGRAYLAI